MFADDQQNRVCPQQKFYSQRYKARQFPDGDRKAL